MPNPQKSQPKKGKFKRQKEDDGYISLKYIECMKSP